MRKLMTGLVVATLLATSCELEQVEAEPELLLPAPDQTGIERSVDPLPAAPTPSPDDASVELSAPEAAPTAGIDPVDSGSPVGGEVPAPTPPSEGVTAQLVWSFERNADAAGSLSGASLNESFDVRLEVDGSTEGIERVEWYIDGVLFRDDDIEAPYNLRYSRLLPIDEVFGSDQGLDGVWTLATGVEHVITAKVLYFGAWTDVEATFTVVDGEIQAPATTTTAPPATTVPPTTTVPAPTTTVPATTTTVPATTTTTPPPSGDDRPIVYADSSTVLDQPNTIYDFQFSSPGDVQILASNVEARNIRGPGARRIGDLGGLSITDSGFRNFEFTFAHVRMSDGATMTRPYFIDGVDVNSQPNVSDGDILQVFAYEGDIIDPLIDNVTIYGKQRPEGSDAHNDGIQFTGIGGGEVWNPTVRNSHIEGASSAGIQAKHVHGVFTIEGNTLSERFGSYHAVIAKPGDSSSVVLWRNNTMIDGASAAMTGGWGVHPDSVVVGEVTIQ